MSGDVDGDGLDDLFYLDGAYWDVYRVDRDPQGVGFGSRDRIVGSAASYAEIELRDMNGDGHNDLVTKTWKDSTLLIDAGQPDWLIQWQENVDGQGTYGTPNPIAFPEQTRLGDVDGDGDLDAVSNANFRGVVWTENQGGVFDGFQQLPVIARNFESIRVADYDLDGDADVLAELPHGLQQDWLVWFRNDGVDQLFQSDSFLPLSRGRWSWIETVRLGFRRCRRRRSGV